MLNVKKIILSIYFIGLLLSLFLFYESYYLSEISFCPTEGCNKVLQSSYSSINGIPVALIGSIGYLVLFNSLLFNFIKLSFYLNILAFGFSFYLTLLSVFTINALCFWCIVSFFLITTAMIINWIAFHKKHVFEKFTN